MARVTKKAPANGSAGMKAVQRAIDILSCFTVETPERGVSEVGEALGLSKGSVHRLLTALKSRQCVDQDPDSGKYRLGTKLLELAAVLQADRLIYLDKARPTLERLAEEVNETVVVNVLDGDSHLCTAVIDAPRPVRFFSRAGLRRRPYFGAAGQVLLAWQSEEMLKRILPVTLETFTGSSITNRDDYLRRLRQVRQRGHAVDRGETFPDVTGLGAPIFDHKGATLASVTIVAPTHRLADDRLPPLLDRLHKATATISAALGAPAEMIARLAAEP